MEWTCGHGVGEGMSQETGIDGRALPHVTERASGNLLSSSGSSAWCSVTTQRGGMGEGGRKVQGCSCRGHLQLIKSQRAMCLPLSYIIITSHCLSLA